MSHQPPLSNEQSDLSEMALRWYGYGRWDCPYWFIGPEPGQAPRMMIFNHALRHGSILAEASYATVRTSMTSCRRKDGTGINRDFSQHGDR